MKTNQTAPDMFAALEHKQRIAHFPPATDYPACAAFYGAIIDQYHAAMMKADTAAALVAKENCKVFRQYFYDETPDKTDICPHDVSLRLSKSYRAPEGALPKWGQEGSFTITVGSVPVRIEVESLGGLGMYGDNLMPHFAIHIVEKTRLFLSHTGYRSFFLTMTDTEPETTLADAIGRVLRTYLQTEMKGKMVPYDPYAGYSATFRRERMIADGVIPADPDTQTSAANTPVDDDDLQCDGCDASLSMVDEFTENECGTFCARCFLAHTRSCDGCEIDLIKAHGGVHPSPRRDLTDEEPEDESEATGEEPAEDQD